MILESRVDEAPTVDFHDQLPTRSMYARSAAWLLLLLFTSFKPTLAQEPGVQPELGSVIEGIPTIPFSLATEVGRYSNIRAAEILTWHPVRREMLIVTALGNTPQVHLVKFPGGARTQLTFFQDRTSRGVSYQPTRGDYFIFSKDSGGDQKYQNYRYDLATGNITLLTDGKSRNGPGVWSNRGDRIVLQLDPTQWNRCRPLHRGSARFKKRSAAREVAGRRMDSARLVTRRFNDLGSSADFDQRELFVVH